MVIEEVSGESNFVRSDGAFKTNILSDEWEYQELSGRYRTYEALPNDLNIIFNSGYDSSGNASINKHISSVIDYHMYLRYERTASAEWELELNFYNINESYADTITYSSISSLDKTLLSSTDYNFNSSFNGSAYTYVGYDTLTDGNTSGMSQSAYNENLDTSYGVIMQIKLTKNDYFFDFYQPSHSWIDQT